MLISLEWLRDYVEIDVSPEELADGLTMAGLEIEASTGAGGDVVLEIGVTPNRADALSMIGVAREVAALLNKPLKMPKIEAPEGERDVSHMAAVQIDDFDGCPRYVARVIEGIKVGPSPVWMQKRLEACGMRAINNIVDITNYVLLETGQPLHAFDYNELTDNKIIVRRAKKGEKFTTLDEVEREMSPTDLMICDGKGPVAVAGLMGGLHSEVTEKTVDVLLESAYFDPGSIRATARRLGQSTEASYRFERGVDPDLQLKACTRAISLMAEFAGGTIAKGYIDVKTELPARLEISLRDERVNLYMGVDVPRSQIITLLEPLGFEIAETDDGIKATPPTYRVDISEEVDLIEEVARRYGYGNIPSTVPAGRIEPVTVSPEDMLTETIGNVFAGVGLHEAITLSFMNPDAPGWLRLSEKDRRRNMVELLNPLSKQESVLRTTLLPGLLNVVAHNLNRLQENPKVYEVGRVFLRGSKNDLPDQPVRLAGAYAPSGSKSLYAIDADPFYEVKGMVEQLLDRLKISGDWSKADDVPYLLPGESANVTAGGDAIGHVGRVRQGVARNFDLESPVYVFEVDFDAILAISSGDLRFKPLDSHPPAFRDIAVVVDDALDALKIEKVIRGVDIAVGDIKLFDVYRGKPIEEGKKSLAFSITYRWKDRSPVDDEVNEVHGRVVESLEKEFGAEIR